MYGAQRSNRTAIPRLQGGTSTIKAIWALVPEIGLEPIRPKPEDFKSSMFTYFITQAFGTPPRIRTETTQILRLFSLPVGIEEHWYAR